LKHSDVDCYQTVKKGVINPNKGEENNRGEPDEKELNLA